MQTMIQDQQDDMMNAIQSIEGIVAAIQDQQEKMMKVIQSIESQVDAMVPDTTSQCMQQGDLEAKVKMQLEITQKMMEQIKSIDAVIRRL